MTYKFKDYVSWPITVKSVCVANSSKRNGLHAYQFLGSTQTPTVAWSGPRSKLYDLDEVISNLKEHDCCFWELQPKTVTLPLPNKFEFNSVACESIAQTGLSILKYFFI